MTGVLRQATNLSPVWYSNNRCITLDVSSSNIATLDFHSNDAACAPSTQLYDARIQVLNGSNSTYGGGSMYIYASSTIFYTPVYVLDPGGIWWGSAATGSQMTPTIAASLISNVNKYLTALPSTANFTSLTLANNAVAIQSWVTRNGFLTALPNTVALLAGAMKEDPG